MSPLVIHGLFFTVRFEHLGFFSNPAPDQKHIQYYDYCSANVEKFVSGLQNELINEPPENFNAFSAMFNSQLDIACKLKKPKCSKRTVKNNPWIPVSFLQCTSA